MKLDPKGKVLMEIKDVQADKIMLDAKDNIYVFSRRSCESLFRSWSNESKRFLKMPKMPSLNPN